MRENRMETRRALEEFKNENYVETDFDKLIKERREIEEQDKEDKFITNYHMEDTPY